MSINCNQLNLKYYEGEDLYSDGDIEDELLAICSAGKDVNEILKNDTRWPILYHLSPERRNLLEWFPFNKDYSLLEIGVGCGALTGLFAEKVKFVQGVELSKRRATIAATRVKKYNNLEIMVGNFSKMKFEKKFEYVTLIGVLEYAGKFVAAADPYVEFLNICKEKLTCDGTLIIAIENRYGLKYWAGAQEDHTSEIFDGIEGYKRDQGIRTFGKRELEALLQRAGFKHWDFYYPMPDYKLPDRIFSDSMKPQRGAFNEDTPNYVGKRLKLFDEVSAYNGIIDNDYFDIFANSFLVFCRL